MLSDGDRADITEETQEQEKKCGVKIVSPAVSEMVVEQLVQRWRQITPRIAVSERIERQRKAARGRPSKEDPKDKPVGKCAELFAVCRGFDHFSASAASAPNSAQRE